jgi:hypothetical protein
MILDYQPLQRYGSTLLFRRVLVPILKTKSYFIMEFSLLLLLPLPPLLLLLLLLLLLGRLL